MDVRDPSAGLPVRQPSDGVPSRQPGGTLPTRQTAADELVRQVSTDRPGGYGNFSGDFAGEAGRAPLARGPELPGRTPGPLGQPSMPSRAPERAPEQEVEAFPVRQRSARPMRPSGGRHRRAVPASLPQSAPALILGVPGRDADLTVGPAAELAAVLRVDNPAVDVRAARIDGGGLGDPSDLRTVLADAAARRPEGPCAVVIPMIATVNPPVILRLREAVAASGTNAIVSGFINSNAMIAEVLHIRLAESGLARADRVRLFSIVTNADGVLIATVGGPDGAASANVTSVLLAARLAIPVITASMDSGPSVHEGAMRLKEMGVSRLAIAPCFIGPEATRADLESLAIGADCAAPLGAHSNIAKLAALTYGQAISKMDIPDVAGPATRGAHE
jgi:hypothetical protein